MADSKKVPKTIPHYKDGRISNARLREIMTAPPMSAAAHAADRRRRLAARRKVEDLHDERAAATSRWK